MIEGRYCFSRAFNRTAKRLIGKISRVEELAQEFVRGVLDHFHLFEDYLLLAFEVFLFEARMRNEVGKQIYRLSEGRVRNLCGEARHLMGRISIQISPQPVSLDRDISSAPVSGAFKDRMLNKVANSVQFGRFVA